VADSNHAVVHLFRFETFEFDRRALELRRAGVKVKLEGQPLRILGMLVERPGELVTREDLRKQLWGADLLWSWHRFEISGEFAFRSNEGQADHRDEQGHYVQAVIPLTQTLYAVGRYEGFHQSGAERDLNLYLGGLAWRPRPALVFKAEYSDATDNEAGLPDGWRASFAVLF